MTELMLVLTRQPGAGGHSAASAQLPGAGALRDARSLPHGVRPARAARPRTRRRTRLRAPLSSRRQGRGVPLDLFLTSPCLRNQLTSHTPHSQQASTGTYCFHHAHTPPPHCSKNPDKALLEFLVWQAPGESNNHHQRQS